MTRLRYWKVVLLLLLQALHLSHQGQCHAHSPPRLLDTWLYQTSPDRSLIPRRPISIAPQWQNAGALDVSKDPPDQEQKQRRKEKRRQEKERREQQKLERERRQRETKSNHHPEEPSAQPSSSPLPGPVPAEQPPTTVPRSPYGGPSPVPSLPPVTHPSSPPVGSPFIPPQVPPPSQPPSLAPSGLPKNGSCGICGAFYYGKIGETLLSVSKICKMDAALLLTANPQVGRITDGVAGRMLVVPCTGEEPASCNQCGASYYIKEGEYLGIIAENCNVDLDALEGANKDLLSVDDVSPGQYLTIPCQESGVSRPTEGCGVCGLFHTVKRQETVSDVVEACSVTMEELQMANPALDGTLTQGQVLNIPCYGNSSAACGICGQVYTVQEDDDGDSIQLKCRVRGLSAANPNVDLTQLDVGDSVNIPCTKSPSCSPCSPMVEINDTSLHNMASMCGVSIELLMYANDIFPGKENSRLKIGQKLSVPCGVLPAATNSCSICGASFSVSQDLNLSIVAEACGVSLGAIYNISGNHLNRTTVSVSYTTLVLPCESSAVGCGPCGVGYTAQNENETLASVAVKCSVYPSTVRQLNPQADFNEVLTGKTLGMPCKNSWQELETSSGFVIRPMHFFFPRSWPEVCILLSNLLLLCKWCYV